jgi:hypothetical protein
MSRKRRDKDSARAVVRRYFFDEGSPERDELAQFLAGSGLSELKEKDPKAFDDLVESVSAAVRDVFADNPSGDLWVGSSEGHTHGWGSGEESGREQLDDLTVKALQALGHKDVEA